MQEKSIIVYDDLLSLRERDVSFAYCQNSSYRIGWKDGSTEETIRYAYLHCNLNPDDLQTLPAYHAIMRSPATQHVAGLSLCKTIINLSTPSDANFIHTHPEKKVLLYYPNMEWHNGWHGETHFYSENLKEVKYTSPYTPGRVIVFDADIPHCIRPQSHLASHYRFTIAFVFE